MSPPPTRTSASRASTTPDAEATSPPGPSHGGSSTGRPPAAATQSAYGHGEDGGGPVPGSPRGLLPVGGDPHDGDARRATASSITPTAGDGPGVRFVAIRSAMTRLDGQGGAHHRCGQRHRAGGGRVVRRRGRGRWWWPTWWPTAAGRDRGRYRGGRRAGPGGDRRRGRRGPGDDAMGRRRWTPSAPCTCCSTTPASSPTTTAASSTPPRRRGTGSWPSTSRAYGWAAGPPCRP